MNDLDFVVGHDETVGSDDVAKVFDGICVKSAFLRVGVKPVLPETSQDLSDLLFVKSWIVGIDQEVI